MQLKWHQTNLQTHTAKHFLGDSDEAWHELIPAGQQQRYREWTDQQLRAECDTEQHADNCPNEAICSPAVQAAAPSYAAAVKTRWSTAMVEGFWVQAKREGIVHTYAVGSGGVFMVAGHEDGQTVRARTAFRVHSPRHTRITEAFRKMRSYKRRLGSGLSERDLVRLHSALLGIPTKDPDTQHRLGCLAETVS
jgi:hypothetical protein